MNQSLVEYFISLATEYGVKTDTGIPTKTEIIEITKICEDLFKKNQLAVLKPLLYEKNPYVVLLSASSLLKIFPDESMEKLIDLRENERGLAGFEAKWLLRE